MTAKITSLNEFVSLVRDFLLTRTEKVIYSFGCEITRESLMPGKMLRTRLADRLASYDKISVNSETLVRACAAVELVHTASLLHDDVIDNGQIRRGVQTFWKATNPSQAVLTGDLLLCEAMDMIQKTQKGRYTEIFITKVREVCQAEIEQELVLRRRQLDETTCMRLSRGKTGPLFAFVGLVCGGDNSALSAALEESGYLIGTAYQLADDLIDIIGDEQRYGKTLGSDLRRGKFTLPQSMETPQRINKKIVELCISALDCLNEWPRNRKGLKEFIKSDLQWSFDRNNLEIKVLC
ncbi:polyprenyl synthetase family protein [Candidatus Latescibacterota bacterium]